MSGQRDYYGPSSAQRGEGDEGAKEYPYFGTPISAVPTSGPIGSWPYWEGDTAGRAAYEAQLAANRQGKPPRPPPPTREEAKAIYARVKSRVDVPKPPHYTEEPLRLEKQKKAATLQTWISETMHVPARTPGYPSRGEPSTSERVAAITDRTKLKDTYAFVRYYQDEKNIPDGNLVREKTEWYDWRQIAGTEYWECPRCNEFVHTDDVKLHKSSHPVELGRYTGPKMR
ncbi:hypothetical protein EXIGLDRAFT_758642 [Exidia glandulosa HHB12029]|uniref:Uncharacterized protein n=1 Tax=Exidia glandulosa HHB12029 TaxID=1314781 RepID=A0A165R142_EXIGL|nr:hypothetical protein EXIGLDRAFT_758642 [Exidia glandulosa HHB12029]